MKRQQEMVDSFLRGHRDFMQNMNKSFEIIEHDLKEAEEFKKECTGEWCTALETSIDELANFLYSISEPRWLTAEDSEAMHAMRHRIHDLYATYNRVSSRLTH